MKFRSQISFRYFPCRLNGLPSDRTLFGTLSCHFFRKYKSSFCLRSSSGSISGISSRIGNHLKHLGQRIKPSLISPFSSKTISSSGCCLSIGQASISISFLFTVHTIITMAENYLLNLSDEDLTRTSSTI